jgi:hypothetical protein
MQSFSPIQREAYLLQSTPASSPLDKAGRRSTQEMALSNRHIQTHSYFYLNALLNLPREAQGCMGTVICYLQRLGLCKSDNRTCKQKVLCAKHLSREPPPPFRPTTLNNAHAPAGPRKRRWDDTEAIRRPARKFLKEQKTCSDECAALAPIDLVVVSWLCFGLADLKVVMPLLPVLVCRFQMVQRCVLSCRPAQATRHGTHVHSSAASDSSRSLPTVN